MTPAEPQKHVMIVFGTRPEAIKMMPLVKVFRRFDDIRTTVVSTGQHRQMLDQVLSIFGERADIDLNLMVHNQTLSALTASVLNRTQELLDEARPDIVLVQGDTTTAMAIAVGAFYARCKIGHVEAGLRSFDLDRPWPEEFNRLTIDRIADYMFAPTTQARENLLSEKITQGRILVTGNTGIDSLLYMSKLIDADSTRRQALDRRYGFFAADRHLVLITGHRRESFGAGFQRICDGLLRIAERTDVEVVYPVHLNPNVRGVVYERLGQRFNIHLLEPVDYLDMIYLMKRAKLILTDSGGIQEEAPALGKPVLVMRDVTERPEGIETGVVKLVGTEPDRMRQEVDGLLDNAAYYRSTARAVFPYGDGTAAAQIANFLRQALTGDTIGRTGLAALGAGGAAR